MEQKIVKFNGFSQFHKNRKRNAAIRKAWENKYKRNYVYVDKDEKTHSFTIEEDKIKL